MSCEVKVPALGESVAEATIGEWLKQPGDAIGQDEPIASLETDKVSIEVLAPMAGVIAEQLATVGETVTVGTVIATIAEGDARSAPVAAKAESATEGDDDTRTLSPAVRRAVLEHGIDPSSVQGTGKDGRLTKEDVLAAARAKDTGTSVTAPARQHPDDLPAAAPAGERRVERVKMTRMRQTIARRLKQAQDNAAMLTTFNDVDMSAVIAAREKYKELFEKKHGVRLGFMSFFAKAACLALKDIPVANAYIDGPDGNQEIVYHDYVDLSVAVSAPAGLVVPVVRDCDSLGFAEIEIAIADLGKRAREGTLTLDDMAGGTFTISNGGVFGSMLSTPIINPPQSAVLGLHRIEDRPVAVNGQVVIRPMMYLALSYDHRLIDGREAVTALKIIKDAIEDPTRILIDL